MSHVTDEEICLIYLVAERESKDPGILTPCQVETMLAEPKLSHLLLSLIPLLLHFFFILAFILCTLVGGPLKTGINEVLKN